jgi:hypothetical protein
LRSKQLEILRLSTKTVHRNPSKQCGFPLTFGSTESEDFTLDGGILRLSEYTNTGFHVVKTPSTLGKRDKLGSALIVRFQTESYFERER